MSVLIVAVFQILLVFPLLTLGYVLIVVLFGLQNLVYYYVLSGIVGIVIGKTSVFIFKETSETHGKLLPTKGVSAGLFGMLTALYASWLFSPYSLPFDFMAIPEIGPRGPMDTWIAAFVYYMMFNLPFIYIYLKERPN